MNIYSLFLIINLINMEAPKNNSYAIQRLKMLIHKISGIDIGDFENEKDYINLIDIFMNISDISVKHQLLIILYNTIFIDNKQFKSSLNDEALKHFDLCLKDKIEEKEKKLLSNYIKEEAANFGIMLPEKMFPKQAFNMICLIMKQKYDFSLFFKCFEIVMENRTKKYVPNMNPFDFGTQKTDDLFDAIMSIIQDIYETEITDFFSLKYDGKEFIKKSLSDEEKLNFINKKSNKSLKNVMAFIKEKTLKKKESIKEKIIEKKIDITIKESQIKLDNNNINNINEANINREFTCLNTNTKKNNTQRENDNNVNYINVKKLNQITSMDNIEFKCIIQSFEKRHEELQKELKNQKIDFENQLKNQKIDFENQLKNQTIDFENQFKNQTIDFENKLKNQAIDFENKLKNQKIDIEDELNNNQNEISSLKARVKDLENEKNILKENNIKSKKKLTNAINNCNQELITLNNTIKQKEKEKDTLDRQLNLIQSRTIIKGIMDVVYGFYFKLDFDIDYKQKLDTIIKAINNEKDNEIFFGELNKFIKEIYDNKNKGDIIAHPIMNLDNLFKIVNTYNIVKDVFHFLDLDKLLNKLNVFYRIKMSNNVANNNSDNTSLINEINDLFLTAKDLYHYKLKIMKSK